MRIETLDRKFSLLVRSLAGRCERCGESRELQCSHYFGRRHKSIRWDLDNCAALCLRCHGEFHMHRAEYRKWMVRRLGLGRFLKLVDRKNEVMKMSDPVKEDISKWIDEQLKGVA